MQQHPIVTKIDQLLQPIMKTTPQPARLLGFAGLIPFCFLALLSLVFSGWVNLALLSWAGIVLAGIGMAQFGFACANMGKGPTMEALGIAVLPSLYAWFVLAILPIMNMIAMAIGFAVVYWLDKRHHKAGATPEWWLNYRLPLTIGAIASLLIGAI